MTSISLLELYSAAAAAYVLRVSTHVASYQPGAEVQTVVVLLILLTVVVLLLLYIWVEIVQIVFLTVTITVVRLSQAAKRGQQYVRVSHLPVAHLMHHAHCCLRC